MGRECPACGRETVVSGREALEVFDTRSWRGATSLLEYEETELVCSYCHAVRLAGDWTRIVSVNERAWQLAQASSSKSKEEMRDRLTAGKKTVRI